jgi:hypothetical protein
MSPLPEPTPRPTDDAREVGIEIARLYLEALDLTRQLLVERPVHEELAGKLSWLHERYLVELAVFGCLTDAMSGAERLRVLEAAEAHHHQYRADDFSWFDQALDYYESSIDVISMLHEINHFIDYAMPGPDGEPRERRTPCGG